MTETPTYRLLSVIVPVHDERNTVCEKLRRMRMVDLPVDREIVVVDDGSLDGTDKVLAALADSTVRIVRHSVKRTRGAAVRSGIAVARGDLVLIQDGEVEQDPADWPRLLAPILSGRSKVVFGSRFIGERETVSIARWMGDRSVAMLAAMLFNATISDIETGCKVMDREVLDQLGLRDDGSDPEREIVAKLLRRGHRIYEVPVTCAGRHRHDRRMSTWRDGLTAGLGLVRLRFEQDRGVHRTPDVVRPG